MTDTHDPVTVDLGYAIVGVAAEKCPMYCTLGQLMFIDFDPASGGYPWWTDKPRFHLHSVVFREKLDKLPPGADPTSVRVVRASAHLTPTVERDVPDGR